MVLEALLAGCGCQMDAQLSALDVTGIAYDSRAFYSSHFIESSKFLILRRPIISE